MKKAIAIITAAVLGGAVVAGVGYKSKGFTDWTKETWLGTEEEISEVDENTVAVDENGKPITDGATMPAAMTFLRSASDSRATTATHEPSVTVSAIISPVGASYTFPNWSLVWQDDTVTDDVNEFVTISTDGNNALAVTVTCNALFVNKIDLVFSLTDYYGVIKTATCELNYLKQPTAIDTITIAASPSLDSDLQARATYEVDPSTPCKLPTYYMNLGTDAPCYYKIYDMTFKLSEGTTALSTVRYYCHSVTVSVSRYNNGSVAPTGSVFNIHYYQDKSFGYLDFSNWANGVKNMHNSWGYVLTFRLQFTFDWGSSATVASINNVFDCLIDVDFTPSSARNISDVSLSTPEHTFA